jgi:hypothetical protein
MPRGSFAAMQSELDVTEVTFYYDNGHSEAFNLPQPPQVTQEQLQPMLAQSWLTFHLFDQTVVINTAKITKIEIKPAIPDYAGEGVFANSERVTALQRGSAGRLG